MQAYYGSFSHEDDEVWVISWSRAAQRTERGFVRSILVTATIGGSVLGTPSEITTAMAARRLAYSAGGYDFGILDNSGELTDFYLPTSGSYGGVVVSQAPSYQNVDGAQYVGKLDYQFTLEAEYPANESSIIQYQESLTFSGLGFPIRVIRPCVNTNAVEQTTSPNQGYFAVQSGILISATPGPVANPPIWPDKIINAPQYSMISPEVNRGGFLQQGITWNYQFGSSTPLIGAPRAM